MIYETSIWAVVLFVSFVAVVLGLSFYLGRKTNTASNFFAAGGTINWGVNGIAFAGDYLSAASFLGICGMIAFQGYDGFLYSIGYLAGWVVALFLVAEPLKRLGKYTFTDALDLKFNSKGIQLTAAISTLIVSIFYLIPQMVGAGALVTPLLGLPHWFGVSLVGAIVILIVATAGMTSTTYVQFIKGGLLIVFSLVLSIYIFNNGLSLTPDNDDAPYHKFISFTPDMNDGELKVEGHEVLAVREVGEHTFVKINLEQVHRWFKLEEENGTPILKEMLSITDIEDGETLYNGEEQEKAKFYQVGHMNKIIVNGKEVEETGPLGPSSFLKQLIIVKLFDSQRSNLMKVKI